MQTDKSLYRIVIVEDEWIALRGLTETVDWERYGFRLVGYYRNGRECLDAIKTDAPEVIITDIRMPVMNGLDLLREIRRQYNDVIVILLSGHEEFEYVRQGLHEGAACFLRKASIETDMDEHLPEIQRRLAHKRIHDELVLREQEKQDAMVRNGSLRKILSGRIDTLKESAKRLHGVILVRVSSTGNTQKDAETLVKVDQQLGTLYTPQQIECINLGPREYAVVMTAIGPSSTQFESGVRVLTTRIERILKDLCSSHSDLGITIGVGSIGQGVHYISKSCIDARTATDRQPPQDRVCVCGHSPSLLGNKTRKSEDLESRVVYLSEKERLTTEILAGNQESVSTQLLQIHQRLDALPLVSLTGLLGEIEEFVGSLYLRLDQWRPEANLLITPIHRVFEKIAGITNVSLLTAEFDRIVLFITDCVARTQRTPSIQGITAAVKYIEHHLEENPTLSVVAAHAGISPSHFSVLFKQIIGITFTEYLTDLRMQRALALLKQGLGVKRVGEMVGYTDVQHFRRLFTRKFGVTPGKIE